VTKLFVVCHLAEVRHGHNLLGGDGHGLGVHTNEHLLRAPTLGDLGRLNAGDSQRAILEALLNSLVESDILDGSTLLAEETTNGELMRKFELEAVGGAGLDWSGSSGHNFIFCVLLIY